MTLILASLFVILVAFFGICLTFARPENIERPFMVGAMTFATAAIASWLMWLQWRTGGGSAGLAVAIALFAVSGFGVGRALDMILGPGRSDADDRQATLGAELAD